MPRYRPKQSESLPLVSEDPSGRGQGSPVVKYSRKAATAYEEACARYHGISVAERRRLEREAQARSREAQKAEQHDSPEQRARNLAWMREAAAFARARRAE